MQKIIKFLTLSAIFIVSSLTANASVFKVDDIKVEYKRFNAQTIRKYAVDKASHKGFVKLMKAIVPQEYNVDEVIENYNVKKSDLIEKVNIVDEVNTKGLYSAKFNIEYNKNEIKKLLEKNRIPYVEQTMGKVLLLPVQKTSSDDLLLFEESNKFKQSLFDSLDESLLISPVLAKGDLDEITTYNPQNIVISPDLFRINQLASKYDAQKAITVLVQTNDVDGQVLYQVDLKFVNFEDLDVETFVVLGKNLDAVSKQIANKINQLWINNNLLEFNKPKRFVASIKPSGSLKEFEETVKQLEQMKLVSSVSLKSLNIAQAVVQTDFYGTPQEFLEEAKKKGLRIFQDEKNQWVIERGAE